MGTRAHPPGIPAWCRRALAPLAAALRRATPVTPAKAALAAAALVALVVLAVLAWPTGDGDQYAVVAQPSATPTAQPSAAATTPIATPWSLVTNTPAPGSISPLDPAHIFGNLPPPVVEETTQVSPFDSPRLVGGLYHLREDGTELVRIVGPEPPSLGSTFNIRQSTVSANGRWLAFAPHLSFYDRPQVIFLKDLASQEPARAVANPLQVTDLAISPDGRKLIVAGLMVRGLMVPPGMDFYLLDLEQRTVKELPEFDWARTIRWSTSGEHLVFQQKDSESGKKALYIADGNGENVRELVAGWPNYTGVDTISDVAWSPDGSTVAITSCCDGAGIHLVTLDGQIRALEDARPHEGPVEPSGLAWSPDGTRLAFHTLDAEGDGFFMGVVNVQTGAVVVHGPGHSPVWQRDGSRLAFILDGKLYLARPDARDQWAVISPMQPLISSVAFSLNDSGLLFEYETPLHSIWKVTPAGADEQFLGYGDIPVWSPEGSMIAFVGRARVIQNEYGVRQGGENEVWVMNADGTDPHKVGKYRWYINEPDINQQGCFTSLAWSADGAEVFFDGLREQVAAPADGSRPPAETRVVCDPSPSPAGSGSKSPDGKLVAQTDPGSRNIRILNAEDPQSSFDLSPGTHPSWSPDGQSIAFSFDNHVDPPTVFVTTATKLNFPKKVTPGLTPSWSPDGSQILFTR